MKGYEGGCANGESLPFKLPVACLCVSKPYTSCNREVAVAFAKGAGKTFALA